MVVGMAYDLIGLKPKSSNGLCIRLNIWKWYEFIKALEHWGLLKNLEHWLTNDEIELSSIESLELANGIRLNLETFNIFISDLYSKNLQYSHMPWHRSVCCSILDLNDIKYVLLFLDSCGGFKIQ
jgi:hypothetical protein